MGLLVHRAGLLDCQTTLRRVDNVRTTALQAIHSKEGVPNCSQSNQELHIEYTFTIHPVNYKASSFKSAPETPLIHLKCCLIPASLLHSSDKNVHSVQPSSWLLVSCKCTGILKIYTHSGLQSRVAVTAANWQACGEVRQY